MGQIRTDYNSMKKMQSLEAFRPSSTLYEKMFREKPYTKCVDCLFETRLKCRRCMESIIEEMTKKPKPKRAALTHKFSSPRAQTCKSSPSKADNPKENMPQMVVTSKYNWWMCEQVKKRLNQSASSTKALWPRKTKNSDPNLEKLGAQPPLFERWERKLVDQLTCKAQPLR